MNVNALQFQKRIVVDVVQVQEREHARIGARPTETLFRFGAVQVKTQQTSSKTPCPFIEIAQDDARRRRICIASDDFQKPVTLVAAFKKARAEMDVERLQRCLCVNRNRDFQAATRFIPSPAKIVIVMGGDRKSTENSIAISRAA